MNQFTACEQRGRRIFKQFLNSRGIYNTVERKRYGFSKDKYCPIDGALYKGNNIEVFEIKYRFKLYDTIYMEYSKFKSMTEIVKSKKNVRNGYYINLIQGKMYIYKLSDITKYLKETPFAVKKVYCPVTTAADNGRRDKLMIDLPISLAKVYELDYWE